MRKTILAGAAIVASLAFTGVASADAMLSSFDDFANGSVDSQQPNPYGSWKATGPYDQEIVNVPGGKALRISNAITSGSFADMPYSAPVSPAGEHAGNNTLMNQFKFKSATGDRQPGLAMSVSPTDGDGARMSYVRLEDSYDGVRVFFRDATFTDKWIATVDRGQHTVRFDTTFVPGYDNDIVRVSIDGTEKVCGTSWENYYRFDEQRDPVPSDRLMWRLNLTPTDEQSAALKGNGFLFDDVTSASLNTTATPCSLPVGPPGPAGPKGDTGDHGVNGTDGVNGHDGLYGKDGAPGQAGKDGATTTITQSASSSKLIGATIRTLHVPSIKDMKLVSVRGSLRNKHLPVHGRSITVDLRGKVVGNYNVFITAKYRAKSGKIHTVPSTRSLSITLR